MTLVQREKRVPLRLPLELRGDDAAGEPFEERTHCLNVSGGGLCFETSRTLAVGARLQLSVELPPALRHHFGGQPTYETRAVVCRVEPADAAGSCRVGARFLTEKRP